MLSAHSCMAALLVAAMLSAAASAQTLQLRANGVPLEIRTLRSAEAPEALLERYRAAWSRQAPLIEERIAAWHVLGRQVGARHETLQIRPAATGGTEGYIAWSDLSRPPARVPSPPIALPRGAVLLNAVESGQQGRVARQFLSRAPQAAAVLRRRIALSARSHGFVPLVPQKGAGSSAASEPFHWSRGSELLVIVVQPAAEGSSIWMHHETNAGAPR